MVREYLRSIQEWDITILDKREKKKKIEACKKKKKRKAKVEKNYVILKIFSNMCTKYLDNDVYKLFFHHTFVYMHTVSGT